MASAARRAGGGWYDCYGAIQQHFVRERDDPSMFGDLNLDQLFAAVTVGRDEYDLMPFFGSRLRDVRAVEYRHEVQRDLENKAVSGVVAEFADRMREMRKHLVQAGRLRNRYQQEHWFLHATSGQDLYQQVFDTAASEARV